MNTARISMLLDNYAACFPAGGGVPQHLHELWLAAKRCAVAFDPAAEDLCGMLRQAFAEATPMINYTSSVQPLFGMYALAEPDQAPEEFRRALNLLLADDRGSLAVRQAQMKGYCDRCGVLLQRMEKPKRSWEQNLRAAITLLAIIRPEENYIYKSTEARYMADMLGCPVDMASGAHFSLASFYGMCDALAEAVVAHPVLSGRIIPDDVLSDKAMIHLMVSDMLLNAGEKKLALFGDAPRLIQSRSRAGQADQEREARVAVLRLEMEGRQQALADVNQRLEALTEPELVGQRFISRAFGQAVVQRVEGSLLYLETAGGVRRMSQPNCFLQGHLIPEDPDTRAYYNRMLSLLEEQRAVNGEIINLQCAIDHLSMKKA